MIYSPEIVYKSSAVADMGDCLATVNMGRKVGAAVPLLVGELGPHLTRYRLGWGIPPYQVASWSMQPLGHIRHGPKSGRGAAVPLSVGGKLDPHLTQYRWAEAYLHTKWHLDPSNHLATTDVDRKVGDCCMPLSMRGSWAPSNAMWPGPRPTSVPSGILIRPAVWPH